MLKINLSLIVVILFTMVFESNAQSQIVEIESTTQGFLPPRMATAQRDSIVAPSNGLIIFNTTTGRLNYHNDGWLELYPGLHGGGNVGKQNLLDAGETPLDIINAGASPSDFIGLNYQGGIIFYIEADGTGFISALSTKIKEMEPHLDVKEKVLL